MSKSLIVVDMQNDFVTGSLGSPEAQAIVGNIQNKIASLDPSDSLIFTMDTHFKNYPNTGEGKHLPVVHCQHGSEGWEIIPELNSIPHRSLMKRTFGYTAWQSLKEVATADSIELCGVCTDICVVSNALILRAAFPDKTIIVDASCCAGSSPENHLAALQVLKSCHIDVVGE